MNATLLSTTPGVYAYEVKNRLARSGRPSWWRPWRRKTWYKEWDRAVLVEHCQDCKMTLREFALPCRTHQNAEERELAYYRVRLRSILSGV